VTNLSTRDLPRYCSLAKHQASAIPGTRIKAVLNTAIPAVNATICHSAEVMVYSAWRPRHYSSTPIITLDAFMMA
jgi:hypothetical protein